MRDTGLVSTNEKHEYETKVTLRIASGLQFDERRGGVRPGSSGKMKVERNEEKTSRGTVYILSKMIR
jgi:hypothetical protein